MPNQAIEKSQLDYLRDLIETYATTSMPFEQFLSLALGEERAERIRSDQAERAAAQQRALSEGWHDRL